MSKLPKTMKALVWLKKTDEELKGDVLNNIDFVDVPTPTIKHPKDVIVRTTTLTICGTDLGIMHNKQWYMEKGRILGHEAVGVIEEVGPEVKHVKVGDKVIVPAISPCGECYYCKRDLQSHCSNSEIPGVGWIFGHMIDGTHSEYVRVPFGDTTCIPVPKGITEEQAIMVADILPTCYEIGVLSAKIQKGSTVLIVGAGPIGLSGLVTAMTFEPSKIIMADLDDARLDAALKIGATHVVNSKDHEAAVAKIKEITGGLGVDAAIEAVGYPATWKLCEDSIAIGGHISVVGVHGKPVDFHLEKHWINNITLSTGLVNCFSVSELLEKIGKGLIDTNVFSNPEHRDFKFSNMKTDAYRVFANAPQYKALKVIIHNDITKA